MAIFVSLAFLSTFSHKHTHASFHACFDVILVQHIFKQLANNKFSCVNESKATSDMYVCVLSARKWANMFFGVQCFISDKMSATRKSNIVKFNVVYHCTGCTTHLNKIRSTKCVYIFKNKNRLIENTTWQSTREMFRRHGQTT